MLFLLSSNLRHHNTGIAASHAGIVSGGPFDDMVSTVIRNVIQITLRIRIAIIAGGDDHIVLDSFGTYRQLHAAGSSHWMADHRLDRAYRDAFAKVFESAFDNFGFLDIHQP